jgi:GDP-4-dehydro-6-deoxy-D-mannose reductase
LRVLITGVAGFVGGHLAEWICHEQPAAEVYGLLRPHGSAPAGIPGRVALIEADLDDPASVEASLDIVRPDRIVHLAAQSSVHLSWSEPAATLRTNVHGLLHILEAVRRRSLSPRILVVGSAEEYGVVDPKDLPLTEEAPLRPNSPYAVSKVAQGFLAFQYAAAFGMGIVRTRTFPHTGPGRADHFAESSFARQIAEIETGDRPPVLQVGNLEAVRDFADVRDVVGAYWALLDAGQAGEVYNVCTGRGARIRDLLHKLIEVAGVDVEVRVDLERLRPSDIPVLVGDPRRLREATGWEPRIPLDVTLRDLLDHWRKRVGRRATPSSVGRARAKR